MARRRPYFFLKFIFGFVTLAVVLFLSGSLWLPWIGKALIHNDGPAKADIAVVLAGDMYGHRVLKGADLVRKGFVPVVLVSGPGPNYGMYESDLAIAFAVSKGNPQAWFIPLPSAALSTRDEAALIVPELQRRNVHSFLLVTSDFHTARARRIWRETSRRLGANLDMRTVAAPDEFFRAGSWWRFRQAQKIVFIEWSKTIATVFGM